MGIIRKQTLQSTLFSYAGIVLGFITQGILMPKLMTKDENGLLGLCLANTIILSYIANLGINSAGNRYFTYFRNHDRQHNGFLLLAMVTSVVGFLLSMGLLFALRPFVVAYNSERSSLFVQYYYLLIPLTLFTLVFNVFDNYAKLLYDSVTGTFLKEFGQRFFVMLGVIAYGLHWLTFRQFIVAWLVSYGLQAALMLVKVIRDQNFVSSPSYLRVEPTMRRQLMQYAGLMLLSGLSTQVIQHIDKVMVNNFAGLAATGVYTISAYFGSVIAAPAQALYKVSGVVIADSWKTGDLANIQSIYRKSCLSQLLIGCLVFIGVAANLPSVFTLFLPGYEAGYYVIIWIGLGKLIDMATGVNGTILATSRYYAYDSLFFILLAAGTVMLNLYLIPHYGLTGAAIGGAFATALFNLTRTGFVWAKFGLQPFSWRNGAVLVIGGLVWWAAVQWPYHSDSFVQMALDIAIRSAGITLLFGGLVYGCRLYKDV